MSELSALILRFERAGARRIDVREPCQPAGALCLVTSGPADLFLTITDTDGGTRRSHWQCLEPGQVFALPVVPDGAEDGWTLQAREHAQCLVLPEGAEDQGPEGATALTAALGQWLALLEPPSREEGATAAAPAGQAPRLQALLDAGRAGLRAAHERRREEEIEEEIRLQRKAVLSRQALSQALGHLASLFSPSTEGDEVEGDALLVACQLLGARQGIEFKPPTPGQPAGKRGPLGTLAEASGVRMRTTMLKGRWWEEDNGPLLTFVTEGRRPVALLRNAQGRYEAVGPKDGLHFLVDETSVQGLSTLAFQFYRKLPSTAVGVAELLRFCLRDLHRDARGVLLIGLLGTLLSTLIPIASGHLFDDIIPAADSSQLAQILALLAVIAVASFVFELYRAQLLLRIESRAGSDLQAAIWDRVLKLPVPFFRNFSAGDLATRINGINEIRQLLSGALIGSAMNCLFSMVNLVLMLHYSVPLTALAVALVLVAAGFHAFIGRRRYRYTKASADIRGETAGRALEYLSGLSKLRMTGAESKAFANWSRHFADQQRLQMQSGLLGCVTQVFNSVFPVLTNALLFALISSSALSQHTERFSSGDFVAFSALFALFLNAMLGLVRIGVTLLDVIPIYQRALPILTATPEAGERRRDPGRLRGAIEVASLSFSYPGSEQPVLQDVSLTVEPGQFVALVGESGSGKSTLLRLLLGFEKAQQGDIYYDRQNLHDIDLVALRSQLGVVLQGGKVMSGDIFKNIVGASSLSLDDAWEAARSSGLAADIQAMPMGMHTVVSDGGSTLSGGQRQRLIIARAIAHKPAIVYFDEATSALDNRTQAIVSESLGQLRASRIVIAHRLSTILHADCIYVLDKGRIVQRGTYSTLMQTPGLFADMAKRQLA
ncbi:NHLP bacteriocin export ABC transporter permease/ATPase subunit [Mitsuaria sp. WAJ17]|uniref:NHLP bacteriocin export ABC transporter permease/ATPase subunit n=1 Tax=Mitsuaria sp. WAJ17 TaxID=2761452 RepID=UPI0015FF7416|nr:NHLP bacteriocin export ABC transporter permease/ATPase subunit [Mitsuaria sp. WAJ17]MBB2484694.1 NHLP bacteriocin export ABC transporter permease/ATPase subunit [Mitsuaria sp. WAJ17]